MNPTVRKLLRQNNAREKALSPESQAGMTDVVVYLCLLYTSRCV